MLNEMKHSKTIFYEKIVRILSRKACNNEGFKKF